MTSIRAKVEECPRMKALRDFLAASPCDSDRKWAEYVALAPDLAGFLNPKRGPAAVSSASSTTTSTASLRVRSSAAPTGNFHAPAATRSSPTSALALSTTTSATASVLAETSGRVPAAAPSDSPSATVQAVLVSHDTDLVSMPSTNCKRRTQEEENPRPPKETCLVVLGAEVQQQLDVVLSSWVEAASEATLQVLLAWEASRDKGATATTPTPAMVSSTSTTCSTMCLGGDTSEKPTPLSPTAVPTTSASTLALIAAVSGTPEVSAVLQVSTEIDVIHDSVDIDGTGLVASTPTTCSPGRPSRDTSISVSLFNSSAATTSSTTMDDILSELAAPVVEDKAVDVNTTGNTSPTASICLLSGSEHAIGRERHVPMPLTPRSVHIDFNAPAGESPSPLHELFTWSPTACSTECSGHSIEMPSRLLPESYKVFSVVPTVTAITTWPPPSFTRAETPLMHRHDLLHHAQQKRGKEFLVRDSEGDLNFIWFEVREDSHPFERIKVVKLKPPWTPSLGMCMNLPMGKILSPLASITINDKRGPCKNWCWDDMFWKLPKCWPDTSCAHPTNAILNVSFCPWITSKHAEVQFQFSYPLFPVNCQFARMHFLLSGRVQMNMEPNRGTSLNLVVYHVYHALNIAYSSSWGLIIVGCFLQYGIEDHVVLLLISWLGVPCLQLFLGLACAMQRYMSSRSSAFIAFLNEETVVKQHYACTRVLLVDVCKRWILHHILRVNPHYSELMLLKSWFHYCGGEHESLYSCEKFQWTIAWCWVYPWANCPSVSAGSPGVPIFLWFQFTSESILGSQDDLHSSITVVKSHDLLMEMVELRPWPSWELFTCIAAVIRCLLGAFHILTSSAFILKGISSRSNHYLEMHTLDAIFAKLCTLAVLHAGEFYLLWRLYSSCNQSVTVYNSLFAADPFGVGVLNAILLQDWLLSCLNEHIIQCGFVVTQWKIAWSLNLQHASGGRKFAQLSHVHTLQAFLSVDGCHYVTSSKASTSAFQLPAYVVIWGSCSMNLGQGKLSWDPGIGALVDHGSYRDYCSHKRRQVHWDPGDFMWHRLGVKPKFKEGGLSATSPLVYSWAGRCAAIVGPGLPKDTSSHYKYEGDGQKRLGSERDGTGRTGGFSRGG